MTPVPFWLGGSELVQSSLVEHCFPKAGPPLPQVKGRAHWFILPPSPLSSPSAQSQLLLPKLPKHEVTVQKVSIHSHGLGSTNHEHILQSHTLQAPQYPSFDTAVRVVLTIIKYLKTYFLENDFLLMLIPSVLWRTPSLQLRHCTQKQFAPCSLVSKLAYEFISWVTPIKKKKINYEVLWVHEINISYLLI